MMRSYAVCLSALVFTPAVQAASTVTYHKDVEAILQKNCLTCHRPGEATPMSMLTYKETRPWAKAIRAAVIRRKMPPWFADPAHGQFRNDRRLSQAEIDTVVQWVDAGAPEGDTKDAPKPLEIVEGRTIGTPDAIFEMPKAFMIPATGKVPYQYITVPTHFTEDKWVQAAEIRPGNRAVVHHIQAHAVPGDRPSLKGKIGEFLDAEAIDKRTIETTQAALEGKLTRPQFHSGVEGEYLQGYTPGSISLDLKPEEAKLVKAGSVILFQLHYTSSGKEETDQSPVGLIFAKEPPMLRIHTANVQNFAFTIPPPVDDYPVSARARTTRDLTVVNLRPHMHFRGKSIEYKVTYPSGESEILFASAAMGFQLADDLLSESAEDSAERDCHRTPGPLRQLAEQPVQSRSERACRLWRTDLERDARRVDRRCPGAENGHARAV
jgi:mono/diheme cytochrome c family protein